VFQNDGDLVIYHDGQAVASTGVYDSSGDRVTLETDGNLVEYSTSGQAIWASNTPRHNGGRLRVQDDCDVVLLDGRENVYWHTNTGGCTQR
jgi:hypothetical protein